MRRPSIHNPRTQTPVLRFYYMGATGGIDTSACRQKGRCIITTMQYATRYDGFSTFVQRTLQLTTSHRIET